jgi:hypothetical protein
MDMGRAMKNRKLFTLAITVVLATAVWILLPKSVDVESTSKPLRSTTGSKKNLPTVLKNQQVKISDDSKPTQINIPSASSSQKGHEILDELTQYLRASENKRIEAKKVFENEKYGKRLQIVLRSPNPDELESMNAAAQKALSDLKNTLPEGDSLNEIIKILKEQISVFTVWPEKYRILQVQPYYSGKQSAWSFFYVASDCSEVVLRYDGQNRETGFASSSDGGKREETEDRMFCEWRYKHLFKNDELLGLVPSE